MKWSAVAAVAAVTGVVSCIASAAGEPDEAPSPVFGVRNPTGYRDWKISYEVTVVKDATAGLLE